MTQIGADPEHLRLLATQFRRAEQQLGLSRSVIDSQIRRSPWTGTDADNFRAVWSSRHRTALDGSSTLCRSAAKHLDHQLREQLTASSPNWPSLSGLTAQARTPGQTATPAHTGSAPANAPEPPVGTFPDDTLTVTLGGGATISSIALDSEHRVAVDAFGASRLVTVTDSDGVGLKGSVGASLSSGIGVGAEASAGISAGIVTRRTFETDSGGVWRTIGAIEVERSIDRVISATSASGLPAGALGRITGFLRARVNGIVHVLPTPMRTETLVELRLGASVGASAGAGASSPRTGSNGSAVGGNGSRAAAGAGASASGVLRAGTASGTAGSSYVVEVEGSMSRSIGSSLFARPTAAGTATTGNAAGATSSNRASSHSTRIELTPGPGSDAQPPRVVVTTVATAGSTSHRSVSVVDLDRLGGATGRNTLVDDAVRRVVAQARSGRTSDALATLRSIRLPDGAVTTYSATFDTTEHGWGLSASGGVGATYGGQADVGVTRSVRR